MALQLGPRVHGGGPALRVFQTRPLKLLWQAEVHSTGVAPSGKHLITLDFNSKRPLRIVELRDARSGSINKRITIAEEGSCGFVSSSEFACGLGGGRFALHETRTGRLTTRGAVKGTIRLMVGSPDGRLLAIAQENELKETPLPCGPPARNTEDVIAIYDRQERKTRCVLSTGASLYWGDTGVSFSADGRFLLYPQRQGGRYQAVVDTKTCRLLLRSNQCAFASFAKGARFLLSQRGKTSFYDLVNHRWAGRKTVGAQDELFVVDLPGRLWAGYSHVVSGGKRYRRLRVLRDVGWPESRPRVSTAPPSSDQGSLPGFRWVSCEEQRGQPKRNKIPVEAVSSTSAVRDLCRIELAVAPTGVAMSLRNTSPKPLYVDWPSSYAIREDNARIGVRPSCSSPCHACAVLRFPTELPQDTVFADFITLHATEGSSKACEEDYLAPPFVRKGCGGVLRLRIAVRRADGTRAVCEGTVRNACDGAGGAFGSLSNPAWWLDLGLGHAEASRVCCVAGGVHPQQIGDRGWSTARWPEARSRAAAA